MRIKFLEDFVVFLLKEITKIVGNYGIVIIIITILMRIALFPLTLKQEKSMKKMKERATKLKIRALRLVQKRHFMIGHSLIIKKSQNEFKV